MKRLAAAAAALMLIAGGTVAVSAAGHGSEPPTGSLAVDVDLVPGPTTLGANVVNEASNPTASQIADLYAGNGRVLQNGRDVGMFNFTNIVTHVDPVITVITGIIGLPHGSVLTEGTANLTTGEASKAAIIGGTGAYGGARGTVTVTPVPNTGRQHVVLRFVP